MQLATGIADANLFCWASVLRYVGRSTGYRASRLARLLMKLLATPAWRFQQLLVGPVQLTAHWPSRGAASGMYTLYRAHK